MAKYIDAEKLKAEIQRRMNINLAEKERSECKELWDGAATEDWDLLAYIDAMTQEEPIPLTTDILEASGFLKSPTFVQRCFTSPDIKTKRFVSYTLVLDDGCVVITVTFDEEGHRELEIYTQTAHVMVKDCQHVHELQHALRLCGIDKEIFLQFSNS